MTTNTPPVGFPTELSLGAPRHRPTQSSYFTKGGVEVSCEVGEVFDASQRLESLIESLDSQKGVLFTSSYEFPGRYSRWNLGFVNPPIEFSGTENRFTIKALNSRGRQILPAFG
eukprot:CAMPEP_0171466828 /NCGR_PEP_ID=MMETSP0945-20130129/9540_1 /TAXON_ID=109269 /ORGANISM="Vaucheria litorea, Strain CCMP2940" /LENGTH=113 /DNA_ID=CAMNT_0011995093 /DNA_START=12 /DNA_END=349 /DNA_ORIENTATION=-